jgi:putative ABC transport system permease protein
MKWLLFAVKNVLRNRRRSLVTVLIAGTGTAAMLVGGGFSRYTFSALRESAARETGHVILAHAHFFEGDEDAPMQNGLEDAPAVQAALASDPAVRAVVPRLQFTGLISNGEKSAIFVGTGVDAAGEFKVRGPFLSVKAGSPLASHPAPEGLPEVMLGQDLAHILRAAPGGSLTLLSTTIEGTLNAQDVVVKGIYSTGVPEMDRRAVMVHLATAQKLLLTPKVSTVSVYLRDTDGTEAMRAKIAQLYPHRELQTWRDQAFYYQSVSSLYTRIFGLLGAIIVIIVLFAVSNTLGMAVVERTREIGTFRALGAFPIQVARNFVLEGLVLGIAGAALGILLTLAFRFGIDLAGVQMPPPPGRSNSYPLHIDFALSLCGVAAAAIVLSAVLAAWFVSRKAANRSIVEALAHV